MIEYGVQAKSAKDLKQNADLEKVSVGVQDRGKSSGADKDFGLNVQILIPDLHAGRYNAYSAVDRGRGFILVLSG